MKALWRLIGPCVFIHFARAQPCWFLNSSNLKRASISLTWKIGIMMQPSTDCHYSFRLLQPLQFTMSTPISSRYFWEKFKLDVSVNMKMYEGVRHLAQQISKFGLVHQNSLKWYFGVSWDIFFLRQMQCRGNKFVSSPCIHPMIQVHHRKTVVLLWLPLPGSLMRTC